MNTLALYEHALDHLRATEADPDRVVAEWRSEVPQRFTDHDLFREYAWVVTACGLTPHVVIKHWPRLAIAYGQWDPLLVAGRPRDTRIAALEVMKSPRKIDAIIDFAISLADHPGQMQHLAGLPTKEVLAQLVTLPYVGQNNRYHLARNLGWDVVVRTGPVPRLAAYLGLSPDQLCERIAEEVGERVRTVDLVLWNWGYQVGDQAMKEMASLFRLM